MTQEVQGELIPIGAGETIPLLRRVMTIGRRETCDISLKFPDVSGLHGELSFRDGYWFIRDLGSSNGVKVNGLRVLQRPLRPGEEVAIANRRYTIQYNLSELSLEKLEAQLHEDEDLHSQSLLEKAGLAKRKDQDDDD